MELKWKLGTPSTSPDWESRSTIIEGVHHCQQSQPCSWECHFVFLQLQYCKQHPIQKELYQKQHAFRPTYQIDVYINS